MAEDNPLATASSKGLPHLREPLDCQQQRRVRPCASRAPRFIYCSEMIDLTFTWQASAVASALLGAACLLLAFLERPHSKTPDVDRQRQTLACAALCCQAMACLLRTAYFALKSTGSSSREIHLSAGYLGRLAMCSMYASVLVVSWQWALLCGRIFGWKQKRRTGKALFSVFTVFFAFYMGSAPRSYSGNSSQSFDHLVDTVVSGEALSASPCLHSSSLLSSLTLRINRYCGA